jgi:phage baseplate assembly protein W
MIGMDRRTGKPLAGIDHLRQSIEDILTTRLGERRMLPDYGSSLWRFVDMPATEGWKSSVQAEVARALGRWEPRIKLEQVKVTAVLDGKISMNLTGEYLGDSAVIEVTA